MKIAPADRLKSVTTYYFAKKLAEITTMNEKNDEQVINLGIGSPDLLPPKSVIQKLHKVSLEKDANKYQSYRGQAALREAFSNWYQRFFDVGLNPSSEILPLAGSKEGVMHIHMSLLNPGDGVLVPNPGYPAYRMTTTLAGGVSMFYDLDPDLGWKPDLNRLQEYDLTKVKIMWLNYPNMPTGAKADLQFFESLVRFAHDHDILLCHDNPYAFILNEHPISIFQADGGKDCAIELVSLSKCYNMAGWRVGALAGDQQIIDTVLKFKSNMDSGMYKPLQMAAVEALSMEHSWIESLDLKYAERKKIAMQIMDELGAQYDEDTAGLFVWAKIDSTQSSEEFCDSLLYGTNVFITPGHIFGSSGEGYIRISLCSPISVLEEALNRIKERK